ncbi:hypothetical protein GGX14DRAFT_581549 [Mycena pura]|uniref:Uncharacterized protein n=1 Tax=Mycena pura TaxID=153505 RepID=A0AAD6YV25_9AGAR|nr:hypothetical protein GGX14DRAFT_581549 [Mycena pura]
MVLPEAESVWWVEGDEHVVGGGQWAMSVWWEAGDGRCNLGNECARSEQRAAGVASSGQRAGGEPWATRAARRCAHVAAGERLAEEDRVGAHAVVLEVRGTAATAAGVRHREEERFGAGVNKIGAGVNIPSNFKRSGNVDPYTIPDIPELEDNVISELCAKTEQGGKASTGSRHRPLQEDLKDYQMKGKESKGWWVGEEKMCSSYEVLYKMVNVRRQETKRCDMIKSIMSSFSSCIDPG